MINNQRTQLNCVLMAAESSKQNPQKVISRTQVPLQDLLRHRVCKLCFNQAQVYFINQSLCFQVSQQKQKWGNPCTKSLCRSLSERWLFFAGHLSHWLKDLHICPSASSKLLIQLFPALSSFAMLMKSLINTAEGGRFTASRLLVRREERRAILAGVKPPV